MKVGCQSGGTSTENLEFKARHGVFNLDGGAPTTIPGKGWDLEDIKGLLQAVADETKA
jgi:mannonate dehydratase